MIGVIVPAIGIDGDRHDAIHDVLLIRMIITQLNHFRRITLVDAPRGGQGVIESNRPVLRIQPLIKIQVR